jgi:DNA-binding transcriptional LysR family regulator
MVHEELVSDLEVLDYLELFNSTVESARLLGISQSSCSRRYRAFSERFGIGFDRIADRYQATSNFDVLTILRQAAQKLRVRQLRPRLAMGWQFGAISPPGLDDVGVLLPIQPMNSWRLLSILEQRLVDIGLMGLLEFQSLLAQPMNRLRSRLLPLSPTMLCVPVGLIEYKLLAHRDHPLQGRRDLTSEDLSQYPSPALPLGMAPALIGTLQNHGLANQQCGLSEHNELAWEGAARDGLSLSYASPHLVPGLVNRYDLQPLNFDLGIRDCIGVVGHRDALTDPTFQAIFKQCLTCLRATLQANGSGVHWLS